MSLDGGQVTNLAFCWQLERRDGAGLALTSHDRPLTVGGVRFEPAPGMTPAAIRSASGLEGTTSEIAGALSSMAISETDLQAGRWDGAMLRLFAVDWQDVQAGTQELLEGELGQVSSRDRGFEAELFGIAAKLERPVCPVTSPECRAELGDDRCRVDLAGRRLRAAIAGSAGNVVTIDRPADERFRFGQLRFLAGVANGQRHKILSVAGSELTLRSNPTGNVAIGTAVLLVEGCDKRLESCATRFSNAANFRGEPHLPGNDLLTRYPGA